MCRPCCNSHSAFHHSSNGVGAKHSRSNLPNRATWRRMRHLRLRQVWRESHRDAAQCFVPTAPTQRHTMSRTKRTVLLEILFVGLFAVAFLFLFSQLKSPANLYDEGLVLVNAERIRHGELPYRDFWTMYGPGYFYALAALFSVVEPTMLAARLFDTLLRFLLTIEVYLLARHMTSRWVAFIPFLFVTFWLGTIRFYSYPAFPATAAILLAALALARYLRARRGRWLFATGLALGLTALLRLDFGGYAAFGFGLAVALYELRRASDEGLPWKVAPHAGRASRADHRRRRAAGRSAALRLSHRGRRSCDDLRRSGRVPGDGLPSHAAICRCRRSSPISGGSPARSGTTGCGSICRWRPTPPRSWWRYVGCGCGRCLRRIGGCPSPCCSWPSPARDWGWW